MPGSVYSANYIVTQIQKKLQGDVIYILDDIYDAANEGIEQLLLFTAHTRNLYFPQGGSVANQVEYQLPSGIYYIRSVTYDSKLILEMTYDDWLTLQASGVQPSGTPERWYYREDDLGSFLGLYTTPDTSGKQIVVEMVQAVSNLANPGDPVPIARAFIKGPVHYGVAELLEGEPGQEQRAQYHWNKAMYFFGAAKAHKEFNSKRRVFRRKFR